MKFSSFYDNKVLTEKYNQMNYNFVQGKEIFPYFSTLYGYGENFNRFVNERPEVIQTISETFREYVNDNGGVETTDSEKWNANSTYHKKLVMDARAQILNKLESKGIAPKPAMSMSAKAQE